MGTKAREIVGEKADGIVKLLNGALADEWLAHYQYWVGALVVRGPMRPDVQEQLNEHAADEFKHAGMLAGRIIQLGGTPLLNPSEWLKHSECGYDEPKEHDVLKILGQNIKGEQCAIESYNNILKVAMEAGDFTTFNMVRKILDDEIEHEQDLEDLENDIKSIGK